MNRPLIFSILGVLLCEILFFFIGQPLQNHGYNIIDQQFAWTSSRASEIFNAWRPVNNSLVLFMMVDMVFPALLFSLNYQLHSFEENGFGLWKKISFVGMIFDYFENLLTFFMIFGIINDFLAFTLSLFAFIKFLAVIASFRVGIYRGLKSVR